MRQRRIGHVPVHEEYSQRNPSNGLLCVVACTSYTAHVVSSPVRRTSLQVYLAHIERNFDTAIPTTHQRLDRSHNLVVDVPHRALD